MLQSKEDYAIGRVNALLVPNIQGQEKAVVSPINSGVDDLAGTMTHCFEGVCGFSERTKKHLQNTVFPIADAICEQLQLPQKVCRLSIGNIGATGLHGIGFTVSGYSADAAVCIAMLSSELKIPIDQGIAITGHISSRGGDVKPVKNLPAKIEAAVASENIHTIVIPDLHSDISAQALSPRETEKVEEAILQARSFIKVLNVSDLEGLVREMFFDKSVLKSSLKMSFFEPVSYVCLSSTAVNRTVGYLASCNGKRFWSVLEEMLTLELFDDAKELINDFMAYQIDRAIYPNGFGTSLYRILLSLPMYILRNFTGSLVNRKDLIGLARLVEEDNLEDLRTLFHVSSENLTSFRTSEESLYEPSLPDDKISILANNIVERISHEALSKVTNAIDHARAVYTIKRISVKDISEFNHDVTSFYIFVQRHISRLTDPVDQQVASEEAFALVDRSFVKQGGYKFAYREAINTQEGGLRYIFDTMAEKLKREEQEKYINYVFKTAVEPLSKNEKTELIKKIIDQFCHFLPSEVVDEPESYVDNYADILRYCTQATDHVKSVFKSL